MSASACLLDTNVILRWVQPNDPEYSLADFSVGHLIASGCLLHYASQNLGEFWNVLTRPISRNGYGYTPAEAHIEAQRVESKFQLLPDSIQVHQEWRRMLVEYEISGVQVHDARLLASMRVHGVRDILTFNTRDFARFTDIRAVAPGDVMPDWIP
jgi:predicted nucleic acid-binding protein